MKFLGPVMLGVAAALATFFSTLMPGVYGAALLLVSLVFWLIFIVQILRAVRPE
jgi:hypothetical protein